jgi:hypothetical protein
VMAGEGGGDRSGREAETDLEREVETDLEREVETDLGREVKTDLGREVETHLVREAETDLEREAETDLGREVETDLGREVETGSILSWGRGEGEVTGRNVGRRTERWSQGRGSVHVSMDSTHVGKGMGGICRDRQMRGKGMALFARG